MTLMRTGEELGDAITPEQAEELDWFLYGLARILANQVTAAWQGDQKSAGRDSHR